MASLFDDDLNIDTDPGIAPPKDFMDFIQQEPGFFEDLFYGTDFGDIFGGGGLGGIPWGQLNGVGLGAGLGAAYGSREAGTTTTTCAPWIGQQPYLLDLFRRAQGAADSTGTPSDLENSLYTQLVNLGGGGADEIIKTLRGDYMSPDNPVYKGIMDDALTQWNTSFMPGQMSGAYKMDQTGPLQANSAFGQNVSHGERAVRQGDGPIRGTERVQSGAAAASGVCQHGQSGDHIPCGTATAIRPVRTASRNMGT